MREAAPTPDPGPQGEGDSCRARRGSVPRALQVRGPSVVARAVPQLCAALRSVGAPEFGVSVEPPWPWGACRTNLEFLTLQVTKGKRKDFSTPPPPPPPREQESEIKKII